MKTPPPPTLAERETARKAAAALRLAIADPATMGVRSRGHIDLSRPRRGIWFTTWENLPGLMRFDDGAYEHACRPGWQYARAEILTELIPDLEALATRGERPTEVTNNG